MSDGQSIGYGWTSDTAPHSSSYLTPQVLDVLRVLGARRVLDLGAGNGHTCATLAASGYDVVGLERDEEGIRIARRHHPSIPFYRFGVEDDPRRLAQSERPFDVVVSTEVIEHLYSPELLLTYARAMLEPNGHLIVTTPYHGYLKNLALAVADKWDDHHTALWPGGHIKFWSRRTLSSLLTANGFDVTEFRGVGRLPFLWKSMLLVSRKGA